MGATGWQYYVRHQSDINVALQQLRQEIFQNGAYEKPMCDEDIEVAVKNLSPQLKKLYELAERLEKNKPPKIRPTSPPRTIEELVEQCEESGTHSILDIDHISTVPEFGALTPLSERQLIELFGTAQPTHSVVDLWHTGIHPITEPRLYERWQGIYFTIFKDGVPNEFYIEGASGD